MRKISIVLVDDHIVVRQGLKALLTAEPDFEVVGEAENGQQAVALVREKTPDVVVMDVAMAVVWPWSWASWASCSGAACWSDPSRPCAPRAPRR